MPKILLSLFALATLFAASACAAAGTVGTVGDAPQTSNRVSYPGLPSDIKLLRDTEIIPPDANVPKEWAPFSGAWYGVVRSIHDSRKNNHALVVEWVNKFGYCNVVYSWGANAIGWTGGTGRYSCQIIKRDGITELIVGLYGPVATYRLQGNGVLLGRWDDGKGDTFATTMYRFNFDPSELGK